MVDAIFIDIWQKILILVTLLELHEMLEAHNIGWNQDAVHVPFILSCHSSCLTKDWGSTADWGMLLRFQD